MRTPTLLLALLAGCSAALANPYSPSVELEASSVATARARGPEALAEMLAAYDAMAPGLARDSFALAIDEVAGQRYATTSRLYWYTDLRAAEAEAHARHVPILSLRMLGRLDEDLSCANSRLFRATLYANHDTSAFLRDHFVLHWSSERAVPRVTIDFGDGRVIERTTTGNSAHFVLDEHGRVLDVSPGVYAPIAFRQELENSLALANRVAQLPDAEVAAAIASYQRGIVSQHDVWMSKLAEMPIVDGVQRLLTIADVRTASALTRAQRVTVSKAQMEVPDLRQFGYVVGGPSPDDVAAWAAAGEVMYGIGNMEEVLPTGYFAPRRPHPIEAHVLDAQSRALIERLHDAVPAELVASPAQLEGMLGRLEQTVVADSAIDQLQLRPRIAEKIAATGGTLGFDELDAWIYAEVFKTPRSDAWLGLAPRTDFTGLPGDGIAVH